MISLFSAILIIFALFAISRALLRLWDKEITYSAFFFWLALWAILIVVSLLPAISVFFANLFGVNRGVDLFVYASIILLFYLLFRLYVRCDNLSEQITLLVREIAKERAKKK